MYWHVIEGDKISFSKGRREEYGFRTDIEIGVWTPERTIVQYLFLIVEDRMIAVD
jgi:hypothetical protein